jgi:hypothetical protein
VALKLLSTQLEASVSKRLLILAGIAGSALGAWYVRSRRARASARFDRGTVIFDNTPTAADVDAIV